MRNKYSPEFIEWLTSEAPNLTKAELLDITRLTPHKLECLCSRRGIKYLDYKSSKARHPSNTLPLFSEYVKPDGMTLIKTPQGWEYKQRYIYEQYHHIILPTSVMVIFLDQDKTNFDIDNLRAVSTPVYNTARNKHLISRNPQVTSTALDLSELYQEIKGGDL